MAFLLGPNTANKVEKLLAPKTARYVPSKVVPDAGGGGGGGEAVIGVTRTGGIAARTTTSVPHTFPSATIDLLDPDTGNFYSPNRTQIVFNSTRIIVGGSRVVQAKQMKDSERYFVDVEDCSAGVS